MIGRSGWLVLLAIGAGIGTSLPAQRPAVRVEFHISPRTNYGPHLAAGVEARIVDSIADLLRTLFAERLAFLEYRTDSVTPYTLLVTLDRPDTLPTSGAFEVGFRFSMRDSTGHTTGLYLKTYRPIDVWGGALGKEAVFRLSLALKLRDLQDSDWVLIVRLLSQVPIALSAVVWPTPFGIILPLKRTDYCFRGEDSRLEAPSEVRQGVVTKELRLSVRPGGFTPPADAAPDVQAMRDRLAGWPDTLGNLRFDSVWVRSVHVMEYQKGQCQPPESPVTVATP